MSIEYSKDVEQLSLQLQKNIINHLEPKEALIFRLVKSNHLCPFGLKALELLKSKGYRIIDCHITNDEENQTVKDVLNVKTTPQIFVEGKHIGGYDKLREHFGTNQTDQNQISYRPIAKILAITGLMAIATAISKGMLFSIQTILLFVAFSMCFLALKKLEDLDGFTNGFLGYDLLAKRYLPYAYIYPFLEAFAGLAMISHLPLLMFLGALIALFIGGIGAWSVFKAVYIEKRSLTCACVGGNSKVPLGALSLTENVAMFLMGIYSLFGCAF